MRRGDVQSEWVPDISKGASTTKQTLHGIFLIRLCMKKIMNSTRPPGWYSTYERLNNDE